MSADLSSQLLRLILDAIPDPVSYVDKNEVYRFVNGAYQRWFGVHPDNIIGKKVKDLLKENYTASHARVQQALRGELITCQLEAMTVSGQSRRMEVTYFPDRDSSGSVQGVIVYSLDKTEEWNAQASLAQSAERFRSHFEQAPFSIQLLTPDGRTLQVNSAWKTLFGVPDEFVETFILRQYNLLEDPELEKKGILPHIRRGLSGEVTSIPPIFYDPSEINPQARSRWTEGFMFPVKDCDGVIREIVLTHFDVSDRIEAEQKEQRNEELFRSAAEAIPHLVWIIDHEGTVKYSNSRWLEYTGLSFGDARQQGWSGLVHELDLDRTLNAWKNSRSTGSNFEMEFRFRRKDGTYRWFLGRAVPLRNEVGQIIHWFGTNTDIHEQKRIQESSVFLDEVSVILASSLEYSKTLQFVADLAVSRLADWCTIDILNSRGILERLAVAHKDPAKIEWAREYMKKYPVDMNATGGAPQVVRTGEAVFYPEIPDELLIKGARDEEHLRAIRELGLKSMICVPLMAKGKPFGALTLITSELAYRYDAVDVALARELAFRASHAIENSRLYSELKYKEASLTQAVIVRDDFLSIATHELNTPITSLSLQIEMALRQMAKSDHQFQDPEKLKKLLTNTHRQVRRMGRLIDDMLEVSRGSKAQLSMNFEEVDLTALVREVLERHAEQLLTAKTTIEFSPESPIILFCDRDRIEQVVINLLTNAGLKYGVGKPVIISVREHEDRVQLTVKDHGIGIAENDLSRIFLRFERAVSHQNISGLGLGLYISQQIVEAHFGRIHVTSVLGEGSTFTVDLPRRSANLAV